MARRDAHLCAVASALQFKHRIAARGTLCDSRDLLG